MASSQQFVEVFDADLTRFSEDNENENTKNKTKSDLAIFSEYLASKNERRDIALLPCDELQSILMKFILAVKNRHGGEYEPTSRAMLQSIDRYLRQNNYGASILHDTVFSGV